MQRAIKLFFFSVGNELFYAAVVKSWRKALRLTILTDQEYTLSIIFLVYALSVLSQLEAQPRINLEVD